MKNFPFEYNNHTYWYSRSIVCSAYIFARVQGFWYVLMTQRGPSQTNPRVWNVPGGFLDFDETMEQCAIRETKEETGVSVESLTLYNMDSTPKGNMQHVIGSFYTMLSYLPETTNKYNEPGETSDIRWVSMNDLGQYKILNDQREIINQCYNKILKELVN